MAVRVLLLRPLFRHGSLAAVILALAISRPSVARADACPSSCDPQCNACCKSWATRAGCSNGKGVAIEGGYSAYWDAKKAADEANGRVQSCSGPGPGCRDYWKCPAEGEVAVWAPYCAPDQAMVAPAVAAAASRELDALLAIVDAQLVAVGDTATKLATFAGANNLTSRAKSTAASLGPKLDQYKAKLGAAHDAATAMKEGQKGTEADAKKLRAANAGLVKDAIAAVTAARALVDDSASIDTTAEERARKAADAEAAAAARKADAEAAAAARKADAEHAASERKAAAEAAAAQKREAAEKAAAEADARKAAAAQAKADAEAKRAADAQAKAAEAQTKVDAAAAEVSHTLDGDAKLIDEALAAVTAFSAQPNLSAQGRAGAASLAQKLADLKTKASATAERLKSARGASSQTAAMMAIGKAKSDAAGYGRDARTAYVAAKSLVSSASSIAKSGAAAAPTAAAPPPPPPPPAGPGVPTCDITFEAPPGVSGMSITIDGSRTVPLPSTVKMASGRHAVTVKKGGLREDRTELILCGHVTNVQIDPLESK